YNRCMWLFKYDVCIMNFLISLFPFTFFKFLFFFLGISYLKMSQLSFDCLYEIFEYLENENETLRSCLLVNRLWCEVVVRILWRDVNNYLNFRTLIACLPNESKEI